MTSLSEDQQRLLESAKPPKGWHRPNPNFYPTPFEYHNSYTSPAWTGGQTGGADIQIPKIGGPYNYSNQFTSALTQPRNPANNVPQAGRGKK